LFSACVCWAVYRAVAWQCFERIRYINHPFRPLVPSSLAVCRRSFFVGSAPRVFVWYGFLFCRDYTPTANTAPSLRAARPERLPHKVPADPGASSSSRFFYVFLSLFLSSKSEGKIILSSRCFYITGSCSVCSLFFRFGGRRPPHNAQSLTIRNAFDIQVGRFTNSSPMDFPNISLRFRILSSRRCCFLLRPPILLASFFLFLRCSGSLCHFCIPGLSNVSSRPFVLSGFLFQHHPSLSLTPVSLALCYSSTVSHNPAGSGQFLPQSTIEPGPNFPGDLSLAPCHFCTAGHLPAGGSQFPPASTISSGQFALQLEVGPYAASSLFTKISLRPLP
jgi:hypothetical protein